MGGKEPVNQLETKLKKFIQEGIVLSYGLTLTEEEIIIEIPREKNHGDYSTNVAMRLSKQLKQNPRVIAERLVEYFDKCSDVVTKVEIAGPGFINFFVKSDELTQLIPTIIRLEDNYGESTAGENRRINVEYVSANPTGDLHPGHARGAAIGDSITRIMKKAGYQVEREYYLNDAGNQIMNMARSLQARYFQEFGQEMELPEDGYHGPDLIQIAKECVTEVGDKYLSVSLEESLPFFKEYGLKAEVQKLKDDLALFRVEFDIWTSETSIYERGLVQEALSKLKELNMTYEEDGALWLETTKYGDDKDRVLVKSDGSYTYLTPDIAYHLDKMNRGYEKLIDLLGADHHGYINRLKAAIQALGYNQDTLEVDIIQMARMIKDGKEFKMSKRSGKAIALKDLIEEIGVDAVRYFFVNRAADTHMDFDLDLASKQSNENPVYYAQYAHARMCSILKQGASYPEATSYDGISHEKEMELLKQMNEFPSVIADTAKIRQPHKICNYIQKLAAAFHSFYAECKVVDPQDQQLTSERLALVKATKITLKNALDLIGVSAPEYM